MLDNIPFEMRAYRQWVCWKLIERPNAKPTKLPYNPANGQLASVTDASTWADFSAALAAYQIGGFDGIGFVLTDLDPFGFIDLDDTHGDNVALDRQQKIYQEFNSYSELSPSGSGLHIIVKSPKLPHGRKRASIEVYTSERYMTMTGNVYRNAPIEERGDLLKLLWDQMGGPAVTYNYVGKDEPETKTDEEIVSIARDAVNGEKFSRLWEGDWAGLNYSSQSEADYALVDILAFYTQNRAQIFRLFRQSALGKRAKANRDRYIEYMVEKSFDKMVPPVDIEGMRIKFQDSLNAGGLNAGGVGEGLEPGGTNPSIPVEAQVNSTATASRTVSDTALAVTPHFVKEFPPGLVGEIAQFILDAAPRPVPAIALAGAIGLLSGITGRAYNVNGLGLNQYIMLVAATGRGKEAINSGVSKLMASIKTSVPPSADFIGPGDLKSDASLIKWLSKSNTKCFVSIIGEIGLRIKQMSSETAPAHELGLKRVLLDLYHKSGAGNVLNPIAYSDKEKNTDQLFSPAFTLLGESTPERFYGALDENMITEGLLPRFTIIEYRGPRVPLSEGASKVQPNFNLVEKMATITAHCLSVAHNGHVVSVPWDTNAYKLLDDFNTFCDRKINEPGANEVTAHLWNRAHVKALKLSALVAVGINPFNPVICGETSQWAIDLVKGEVLNLLQRFDNGEVGMGHGLQGSEHLQMKDMIKCIAKWMSNPHDDNVNKYGISYEMHRDGVIPMQALSRRLGTMASFRNDRQGATAALKRTVMNLLDADALREVPKAQMQSKYGHGARSFVISDPTRFVNQIPDQSSSV